jgi:thiol-disulfide isomerase/thioredoxin
MPSRASWVVLVAVAIAGVGCRRGASVPEGDVTDAIAAAQPIASRDSIPASSNARTLDPASLRGKPAIVVFVSPTCKYCLATLPRAAASAQAHAAGLVAVFTVGKPENARDVLDRIHFPGTGLVDDGTLIHRYHISAVPLTFVLGRDGHVRDVYEGEQEQATFDDALAGL